MPAENEPEVNCSADAGVPYSRFDSTELPSPDRFEATRHGMAPLYGLEPAAWRGQTRFDVSMQGWNLGGLLFGTTVLEGSPVRLVRDRHRNHLSDGEPFQLFLYRKGGFRGDNGSNAMAVRPGDVGVIDLGRDLDIEHSRTSDHTTVIIPRDMLLPLLAKRSPGGLVLPREQITTQILVHHLESLSRVLPKATAENVPVLTEGLLNLLATTLGATSAVQEQAWQASSHATFDAVREFIEHGLDSPKLSVAMICRRFGCSRAYLYRLFQPYGGVQRFIQERRLKRCFRQLGSPTHCHLRVIDIAFRNGFTNQSHFSRLFRQRFGVSPSDAREAALKLSGENPRLTAMDAAQPAFYRWLAEA